MKPRRSASASVSFRALHVAAALVASAALVQRSPAETVFAVGSTRGQAGATLSMPLILLGETNVVALQADLRFDTANLAFGGVSPTQLAASHVVASSELAPGLRRVLLYSPGNVPLADGVLANLAFTLASTALPRTLAVSLTNVMLVTANPSLVPSLNSGGLVVMNPILIGSDGSAQFFLNARPGSTNVVQASTNLDLWTDIGAAIPSSTSLEFIDTNATRFPYRFYRIKPPAP